MILLLDNYDSFVHNLARYFQRLGHETRVIRSDAIDAAGVSTLAPQAIVLSPGPRTPVEAGCSVPVVRELGSRFPILGVCLGHQAIGAAFGARIVRAPEPRHGRTSEVLHDERGIFAEVPNPATVCRYHSLVVEESSLPAELEITGRTVEGTIMALRHRKFPVIGLQFHPESILTRDGYRMLANFLVLAGLPVDLALLPSLAETSPLAEPTWSEPIQPLTF